ncbi:unnamed protein product, partial [Effrenium voratum]
VVRPCGHVAQFACTQLGKILQEGVKGRCNESVERPLRCGHLATAPCQKHQEYAEGKTSITCKEKALRECWNAAQCQSRRLRVDCSASGRLCCDRETEWRCEAGHSYGLKLCREGSPEVCPACQEERLTKEIQAVTDALQDDVPLPPWESPFESE